MKKTGWWGIGIFLVVVLLAGALLSYILHRRRQQQDYLSNLASLLASRDYQGAWSVWYQAPAGLEPQDIVAVTSAHFHKHPDALIDALLEPQAADPAMLSCYHSARLTDGELLRFISRRSLAERQRRAAQLLRALPGSWGRGLGILQTHAAALLCSALEPRWPERRLRAMTWLPWRPKTRPLFAHVAALHAAVPARDRLVQGPGLESLSVRALLGDPQGIWLAEQLLPESAEELELALTKLKPGPQFFALLQTRPALLRGKALLRLLDVADEALAAQVLQFGLDRGLPEDAWLLVDRVAAYNERPDAGDALRALLGVALTLRLDALASLRTTTGLAALRRMEGMLPVGAPLPDPDLGAALLEISRMACNETGDSERCLAAALLHFLSERGFTPPAEDWQQTLRALAASLRYPQNAEKRSELAAALATLLGDAPDQLDTTSAQQLCDDGLQRMDEALLALLGAQSVKLADRIRARLLACDPRQLDAASLPHWGACLGRLVGSEAIPRLEEPLFECLTAPASTPRDQVLAQSACEGLLLCGDEAVGALSRVLAHGNATRLDPGLREEALQRCLAGQDEAGLNRLYQALLADRPEDAGPLLTQLWQSQPNLAERLCVDELLARGSEAEGLLSLLHAQASARALEVLEVWVEDDATRPAALRALLATGEAARPMLERLLTRDAARVAAELAPSLGPRSRFILERWLREETPSQVAQRLAARPHALELERVPRADEWAAHLAAEPDTATACQRLLEEIAANPHEDAEFTLRIARERRREACLRALLELGPFSAPGIAELLTADEDFSFQLGPLKRPLVEHCLEHLPAEAREEFVRRAGGILWLRSLVD